MIQLSDLSTAEKKLVASSERGEVCDFGKDDPSEADEWGPERTVRAEVIEGLCRGAQEEWRVHAKGVRVQGARIEGELDFEDARLVCPLHLLSCFVSETITFERARLKNLTLSGSRIPGLMGNRLESLGSVLLDAGFSAKGEVQLTSATIGLHLECDGATFENREGSALSADGLDCKGAVFLRGVSAKGEVRLLRATIGLNLECDRATFENPTGKAFGADGMVCKGDVFFRGTSARGEVRLPGATVGGLDCVDATLENPGGLALVADELDCKGKVSLWGGFSAQGEVRLPSARIGGSLECDGATFENREGSALLADGLDCKRTVFLRGVSAKGEVRLINAAIGGNLECDRATFENPAGKAFSADGMKCRRSVFLRGASAKGEVRLGTATIGGNLECDGAAFENPKGNALFLRSLICEKTVQLTHMRFSPKGRIDFTDAESGLLEDDRSSWPDPGALAVDGFRYGRICPANWIERREWLKLAPFSFQPYEQLASVLRGQGLPEDATRILMEKQRDGIRRGKNSWLSKLGMRFLGWTVGYGYRPQRAFGFLMALFLLGFFVFSAGTDIMVSTNTGFVPFQPAIYSLDTMLPVIDFHMESHWEPSIASTDRTILRLPLSHVIWWYLRLHIAFGWMLSTLGVLAFTGIVRPK